MESNIPLLSVAELSLTTNNVLNTQQLGRLFKVTPPKYVKTRPAKGGGTWKYVSGGYVKKTLNLMFGFDWDFEVLEQIILHGEVVVKGKLTVRSNGKAIIKTQFGNKEIVYKTEKVFNEDGTPKYINKYGKDTQETRPTDIPLSIGNDLKAACTDALKKCAAEIGIAADIYNAEEFKQIEVIDDNSPNTEELSKKINNCASIDDLQMLNDTLDASIKPISEIRLLFNKAYKRIKTENETSANNQGQK